MLYFAAMAVGLVPIASLSELTQEEVEYIIQDSDAALYYQSRELSLDIHLPKSCKLLTDKELQELKQKSNLPFLPTTTPNDPAFIVYTSGSTGKPKGVIHAHKVILGREPIRQFWLGLQSNDIVLITGKPCWTYSMGVGFMDTWVKGATSLVYTGSISPEIWFRLVEHYQVTLFASSPIYYLQMLSVKNPEQYNLSSLRQATSAGVALPYEAIEFWQKQFDVPIYEALGMTEMSTFISSGKTVPIRKGKVGKIQPGRNVAILPIETDSTTPVARGEIGLLAIDRSNLGFMLSYLHPAKNKIVSRDSWFITGDLVSMDEKEYIQHYGRFDDVLIVATGERVAPTEVEEVLIMHPDILDAACGLTNTASSKNILTAFVVIKDKSQKNVENNIINFASKHLAVYKTPKRIIYLEQIPRNPNGKIIRAKLPI